MSDIFDRIADKSTLLHAWRLVKAKASAGGVDSITIEKFDLDCGKYLDLLYNQLVENIYSPEPYRSFTIPKNDIEFRRLGLPAIKDKIVQTASRLVIEPLFDRKFLNVSYGYRQGRGPIKAINRIRHRIGSEYRKWVTIADIDDYFDSIKPEILFSLVEKEINSPRLMHLIKLWVKIGSLNFRNKYEPYSTGIPQGCVLSPLLSNVFLHPFDVYMSGKGYGLIRYADDFVVLSQSQKEGYAAYNDARHFLEDKLMLRLNNTWKVKNTNNGFEFLHITFTGCRTDINEERYFKLLQKLDNSILLEDGKPSFAALQRTMNGIRSYYGKLISQTTLEKLDTALSDSLTKKMGNANVQNKILKNRLIDEYLLQLDFFSNSFQRNKAEKIATIKKDITSFKSKKFEISQDQLIEKEIKKKKLFYEALADKNRELVVASPGIYLGKDHRGIIVKEFGVKKQSIPINTLSNVTVLTTNVSLSGKLIEWCSQNKIPIDFIGFNGMPFAKVFTPEYPDASLILAQTKALENGVGLELMKRIVEGKIKNQSGLVKYYYKYRKTRDEDYAEVYAQRIKQMKETLVKVKRETDICIDKIRDVMMGYEGHASACYWDMVIRLLNDYTVFEQRERQGATDLVNCMLNYGYGILYSRVWQAIIRTRLNPCISFLHKSVAGKPTLAFDLIEEFRQQAVDKVVFAMITKGENVKTVKGQLTPDTRKRLTEKILERLNNKEQFRGEQKRLIEIIESQAKLMAEHILEKSKYKPYVAKW